jgi:hypothetical protein
MGSSLTKKKISVNAERDEWKLSVPAPTVSLQDRTVLRCFAAFFTLSPRDRKNRCTHASLQYCACSPPHDQNKG